MKKEKGITLVSLIIYMAIITATLVALSMLTTKIYNTSKEIGKDNLSSEEFNKFNISFIKTVKNNKSATINTIVDSETNTNVTITFPDGTIYNYIGKENSIYKNKIKIAKNINYFVASEQNNNNKDVIQIIIGTGKNNTESNFGKTINYVLKYW